MRDDPSILIIAPDGEKHAISVHGGLKHSGHRCAVLQFGSIAECAISFNIDMRECEAVAATRGQVISAGAVRSILWINQPDIAPVPMEKKQDEVFAANEIRHSFSGLWSIMNVRWINFPGHISRASYIPEQLIRAKRLGAAVVPFILSNQLTAVESFVALRDEAIYEPFSRLPPEILYPGRNANPNQSRKYYPVRGEAVSLVCDQPEKYPLFLRHIPRRGSIHRYVIVETEIFCYGSLPFEDMPTFESAWRTAFNARKPDPAISRISNELRMVYRLRYAVCDFVASEDEVAFWGLVPSIEYMEWLSPDQAVQLSNALSGSLTREVS